MSLILAISGPTAVGKTTLCERLIDEFKDSLSRLITATTRLPRIGEKEGVDYYFLSQSEFDQKLEYGDFLEHEIIHGNKYGVLKKTVLEAQSRGVNILLNIDVNGAESLRNFCAINKSLRGCLKTIFIRPKSLKELEKRMHKRATEDAQQRQTRLENAKSELERDHEFDFILESTDKESDYQRVRSLYLALD